MDKISYIVSSSFISNDISTRRFTNQPTFDQYEISKEVQEILLKFRFSKTKLEFMFENKVTKSCFKKWNNLLDTLIECGILVEYCAAESSTLFSLVKGNALLDCNIALQKNTIFNCPSVEIGKLPKNKFIVFGVPVDIFCTEKPGMRYGPNSIRSVSSGIYSYTESLLGDVIGVKDEDYGFLMGKVKICDLGDILFSPGENPSTLTKRIHNVTKKITSSNSIPVMLGGDHSVSYGAISGLLKNKEDEDIVVLHFDAHTDLGELVIGRHHHHGNIFARVLKDFSNIRIAQFGIRGFTGIKPENKERYISSSVLGFDNWNNIWRDFLKTNSKVYVSLDIDVVDPVYAPGVGTPVSGGLMPIQLIKMLNLMLTDCQIIGLDIVEVNPLFDVRDMTSNLACEALMYMLTILNK